MKKIMKNLVSFITYLNGFLPLKDIFGWLTFLGSLRIFSLYAGEIPAKQFLFNFTFEEVQGIHSQWARLLASDAEFAKNWQTTFTEPASLGLESIHIFHSDIWLILGTIFFTVAYVGIEAIVRFDGKKQTQKTKNAKMVEFMWTILPIVIVFLIVIPSFSLMYIVDANPSEELCIPSVSVNVTGNQWYWQYEIDISAILDFLGLSSEVLDTHGEALSQPIKLDAYMLPTVDLEPGDLRGLVATNKLILPEGVEVQIYGNSKDVIHSWTVNGFDVKLDAVPGRVNSASCNVTRTGTFFGQCSEVCGPNHGFMPVEVQVIPMQDFKFWIENVLNFRSSFSGLSGIVKYLPGNYGDCGHIYNVWPEKAPPLRDSTFRGEWSRKMYERQAQVFQRFRLMNDLKKMLGYAVNSDESHLLLKPEYKIYKIPNEKGFFYQDKPEYTAMVDKYLYNKWKEQLDKDLTEYFWRLSKTRVGGGMRDFIRTTMKPLRAQTIWFPWRWDQIKAVEPNYISNDYAITLPHAMSFVSCKNQCYGPNFNSYDNTDGNCWYFWWYLSSEWIGETEYQILMYFPKDFGINGEPVLPVMPNAHLEHNPLGFRQELGWRFLTKKLRTWTTCETPTVLVEGFNGQIRDTGVPIDEIWCAKFRFVSVLPPRNMWFRHSAHNCL